MTRSLISFDTDQIKRYVFATDTLKEIRGASRLLDALNQQDMKRLVGGTCHFAFGGSGLFTVDTADVDQAIERVQKAYRDRTGGAATITGVAVELPEGFDEQTDNIQTVWRQLGYRLQAAKGRNGTYHTQVTHPLLRPAHGDERFYAVDKDEEDNPISLVAQYKRETAKRTEGGPEDFDQIAAASIPSNYFALVVADGDGLGQALNSCETLPQLRNAAGDIYKALDSVIQQAVQEARLSPNQYDVLLLGGDDLVVALPAHHAIDFALRVAEGFTQQAPRLSDQPLTLSTAIVWAHPKFPFGIWHNVAESALKFAKQERARRLQQDSDNCGPLINFLVISSPNHLDFGRYYQEILVTKETDKQHIIRTMRPYTIAALKNLISYRRNGLRTIPRSKLEGLQRAVFQSSSQQAMLNALRILVHWRGQKTRDAMQQCIYDFTQAEERPLFPFIQGKTTPFVITCSDEKEPRGAEITTHRTPVVDLVELWDFIPVENAS
ncbi:MAG: hypothetical protein HC828_03075 [Blastochloris sp.]|nr:hypothetical protein [Blastochloris sp.]